MNLTTLKDVIMDPEFSKFIEWAFYAVVGGGVVRGVKVLSKLHTDLNQLSNQFGVVIEKLGWHEKWLTRHDAEIQIHIKEKKGQ